MFPRICESVDLNEGSISDTTAYTVETVRPVWTYSVQICESVDLNGGPISDRYPDFGYHSLYCGDRASCMDHIQIHLFVMEHNVGLWFKLQSP